MNTSKIVTRNSPFLVLLRHLVFIVFIGFIEFYFNFCFLCSKRTELRTSNLRNGSHRPRNQRVNRSSRKAGWTSWPRNRNFRFPPIRASRHLGDSFRPCFLTGRHSKVSIRVRNVRTRSKMPHKLLYMPLLVLPFHRPRVPLNRLLKWRPMVKVRNKSWKCRRFRWRIYCRWASYKFLLRADVTKGLRAIFYNNSMQFSKNFQEFLPNILSVLGLIYSVALCRIEFNSDQLNAS